MSSPSVPSNGSSLNTPGFPNTPDSFNTPDSPDSDSPDSPNPETSDTFGNDPLIGTCDSTGTVFGSLETILFKIIL